MITKNTILPDFVKICPLCKGAGEYTQTYNAGCGMGLYRSLGPCDYCSMASHRRSCKGLGYILKNGKPITESIKNQVEHFIKNKTN